MGRRPNTPGFGKPRWKRAEPREIAASVAAPEPSGKAPEPILGNHTDPSGQRQTGRASNVGLIPTGGDWRKRRKKKSREDDAPRTILSQAQWRQAAPFLTGKLGDRGRTAADNRRKLEGILWIFRSGAPWRDLPAYFGKWDTVHRTFRRWSTRGVFFALFLTSVQEVDLSVVMVDGTFIKVHPHGAGARRHGRSSEESKKAQAIGKTKGGWNTKLMALVDRKGRLVRFTLVPGNAYEAHQLVPLLEGLPTAEIDELLADKAFDTNAVRRALAEMDITITIPSRSRRKHEIPYDKTSYKGRHLVENYFGDVKHFRGIYTRFCKCEETFCGALHLTTWYLRTRGRNGRFSKHLEGR